MYRMYPPRPWHWYISPISHVGVVCLFLAKVFGRMDFTILSLITIWCFYQLALFSILPSPTSHSTHIVCSLFLCAYCNILQLYLLSVRHILFFMIFTTGSIESILCAVYVFFLFSIFFRSLLLASERDNAWM